jgi:hypothetical protein
VNDAGDFVLAHDFDYAVGRGDIQRLNESAFADGGFDEIRLAPHPILGEHNLFANIEESPGDVEADKPKTTCNQNHDTDALTADLMSDLIVTAPSYLAQRPLLA